MAPLPSALVTCWIAARSALRIIRWCLCVCFASAVVVMAIELGSIRLDMLLLAQLASARQPAPSPSRRAIRQNRPLPPNPPILPKIPVVTRLENRHSSAEPETNLDASDFLDCPEARMGGVDNYRHRGLEVAQANGANVTRLQSRK